MFTLPGIIDEPNTGGVHPRVTGPEIQIVVMNVDSITLDAIESVKPLPTSRGAAEMSLPVVASDIAI